MQTIRNLVRLGNRLHDVWQRSRFQRDPLLSTWRNSQDGWAQLLAVRQRIAFAQDHGFQHCLASLREDYRWRLDQMSRLILSLKEDRDPPAQLPKLADWVHEIRAAEDEFGEVVIDFRRAVLRVSTEPITLHGVYLGAFAIELVWTRLPEQSGIQCFDLIPLDPQPASGREEVTHPHINDGELCAGDAVVPVRRALHEGRLCDAFLMIRSVLTTYNARSAYVQLSEWEGLTCSDCGRRMNSEEGSVCRGCDSDLCDHCASSCRSCEETRCGSCLIACEGCDDYCCPGCLERIASGLSVCSGCRTLCSECSTAHLTSDLNADGLCPACQELETTQTLQPEETHVS